MGLVLGDRLGDGDGLGLAVGLGEGLGVGLGEAVGVGVGVTEAHNIVSLGILVMEPSLEVKKTEGVLVDPPVWV